MTTKRTYETHIPNFNYAELMKIHFYRPRRDTTSRYDEIPLRF